jgi:hypothetical protein
MVEGGLNFDVDFIAATEFPGRDPVCVNIATSKIIEP